MRIQINHDRLNEVIDRLKPSASIWTFIGIIFFFFVPEVIALLWSDEINEYFKNLSHLYSEPLMQKACLKAGEMLSKNSILNNLLGLGFIYWWYYERKRSSLK